MPHPLPGRAETQQALTGLLGAMRRQGAAAIVVGEPGIGKTALIGTVAQDAAERGITVLKTMAVPSEAHQPLAAMLPLLEPIVHLTDELPRPQREAILGALGRIEPDGIDPSFLALATLNLLRERAHESPVLLTIEDVQWLDQQTAEVLAFVARRIEHDPIVILASSRPDLSGPLAEAHIEQIEIEGIDDGASRTLVDTHAPSLDPQLRERLLAEANGNPLALIELSIAWSRLPPGTILTSWVPLTTRLGTMFTERFEQLPEPCRVLLVVAAIDGGSFGPETMAAATALTGTAVDPSMLTVALDARLLRMEDGKVRCRHPLVRAAIAQAADLGQRQAAHAALADAHHDIDRATWHRAAAAAGTDEEIAEALDAVAARARRRGAILVAVTALERAAELSPDPAHQGRRFVRAAELAVELGRPDVVERLLDAAELLELDPVDRARAMWRRKLLGDGVWRDVSQIRSLVSITDSLSEAGDVDMAFEALTSVTLTGWWTNFDDERRVLIVEAAERISAADDDPRLLAVLGITAPVERGATVLDRMSSLHMNTIDVGQLALLGATASILGNQAMAADFLDEAIHGTRAQGRLNSLSSVLANRSTVAWMSGDWHLAATVAAEARRLSDQVGRPANAAVAALVEGLLATARGDFDLADALASEVEHQFRPLGAAPILSLASFVHGHNALMAGRPEEAYDHLQALLGPRTSGAAIMLNQMAVPTYFDAAAATGHADDARTAITSLDELARRTRSPMLRACITYARPLFADPAQAEPLFRTALDELDVWGCMHARTLLAYGTWLRRQRRGNESRVPLRAAREAFDAIGAVPWGDRARRELRATGESSAERRTDALELLTPQELEIARLAASGLTNREIGQQLYLSHRTIGSHLYRTFPKLGITSRAELRAALDEGSGRPPVRR